MALIHLDLDEKKSVLEVDGWMRLNWTDEYLRWDPKEFSSEINQECNYRFCNISFKI